MPKRNVAKRFIEATGLDAVVGGDDEEGGSAPDNTSYEEAPAPQYDNSSVEPNRNFDVPMPEYPTEAPHIDTTGVEPHYDDAQLAQNRADTFEHYQDAASPDGGAVGHVGDGWNTGAPTPEYPTEAPHIDTSGVHPQYNDAELAQNRADTFAHHEDTASPIDPEHAINAMVPLPAYPPEAPHIDAPTAAQIAAGPNAQDIFNARVDIAQNYRDLASPSELHQGERGDCFNVAALNALNAENPDYIHQLAQETRRPGVWDVTTVDRHDNVNHEYIQGSPIRGGATSTDPALQAVYNGTSLLYHPGKPGGFPDEAMQRVGANAYETTPVDAVHAYQNGQGAAVLGTVDARDLRSAEPWVQENFAAANLYDGHAYQVSAVIHNDADGRDYAVLTNPWGSGTTENPGNVHPAPIPVDDLPLYFNGGAIGTTRR